MHISIIATARFLYKVFLLSSCVKLCFNEVYFVFVSFSYAQLRSVILIIWLVREVSIVSLVAVDWRLTFDLKILRGNSCAGTFPSAIRRNGTTFRLAGGSYGAVAKRFDFQNFAGNDWNPGSG